MKRLVYSPKVDAWVKTDDGIFDLSPFIVRGSIARRTNQLSNASLTLRNPTSFVNGRTRFAFTEHETSAPDGSPMLGPLFHPMDPITISLTRLRDRPIQVFTGFVDKSPYVQLYPGECTLEASCTLKRLQYTYFDAGLTYFKEFLRDNGWDVNEALGIVNTEDVKAPFTGKLNDTGFGELLYNTLNKIGGWDKDAIKIERVPQSVVDVVGGLFPALDKQSKEAQDELTKLLTKLVGTTTLTGDASGVRGGTGTTGSTPEVITPGDTTAKSWDGKVLTVPQGLGLTAPGGGQDGVCTVYGFDGGAGEGGLGTSCGPSLREQEKRYGGMMFAKGYGTVGGLACGTKVRITWQGKAIVVVLVDSGQGSVNGMDLWVTAGRALGMVSAGRINVKWEVVK